MPLLSYQPRDPNAASSKLSWKRIVPPPVDADTVTAAVPLLPSLVAVIVTEPAATPVTSPLPFTVASKALLVAHVTTRPLNGLPTSSFGGATSCTVWPTARLADAGLTVTEATSTPAGALVVPLAGFERAPNTAFTFSVPRKATSWNW